MWSKFVFGVPCCGIACAAVMCGVCLSACGQTGALYLPSEQSMGHDVPPATQVGTQNEAVAAKEEDDE
ncbi:MAG: lipoprotein [Gammaproteobacteria bacterium]